MFSFKSIVSLVSCLLLVESGLAAPQYNAGEIDLKASAIEVGVRQVAVSSHERGMDLDVTIWYPALSGGQSVTLGDNVFFKGTPAMRDAPISNGEFSLILLSHGAGLGGHAQAMSWIATPLAARGFIVAAPTHPGNTGPDRSVAETMKLWLRPADLSDTLDAIEASAAFQPHLAPGEVGVLGLSMGGNTALAIAGARIDPVLLTSYCDTDALNPSLCNWVKQSGVDLHEMDMEPAGRDNKDARIRFAFAIDPAPADIFKTEPFRDISIPVTLVNLGKETEIPATVQASKIAKLIPKAEYELLEGASHYSMFAECKLGAPEIAVGMAIEDPICADGTGRSRGEIHAQLIDIVTAAFDRMLSTNH